MSSTTNHREYKNKKPKLLRIIQVFEIEYEVEDDTLMPKRTVKEYQKLTGEYIGYLDPIDEFDSIICTASSEFISDATK